MQYVIPKVVGGGPERAVHVFDPTGMASATALISVKTDTASEVQVSISKKNTVLEPSLNGKHASIPAPIHIEVVVRTQATREINALPYRPYLPTVSYSREKAIKLVEKIFTTIQKELSRQRISETAQDALEKMTLDVAPAEHLFEGNLTNMTMNQSFVNFLQKKTNSQATIMLRIALLSMVCGLLPELETTVSPLISNQSWTRYKSLLAEYRWEKSSTTKPTRKKTMPKPPKAKKNPARRMRSKKATDTHNASQRISGAQVEQLMAIKNSIRKLPETMITNSIFRDFYLPYARLASQSRNLSIPTGLKNTSLWNRINQVLNSRQPINLELAFSSREITKTLQNPQAEVVDIDKHLNDWLNKQDRKYLYKGLLRLLILLIQTPVFHHSVDLHKQLKHYFQDLHTSSPVEKSIKEAGLGLVRMLEDKITKQKNELAKVFSQWLTICASDPHRSDVVERIIGSFEKAKPLGGVPWYLFYGDTLLIKNGKVMPLNLVLVQAFLEPDGQLKGFTADSLYFFEHIIKNIILKAQKHLQTFPINSSTLDASTANLVAALLQLSKISEPTTFIHRSWQILVEYDQVFKSIMAKLNQKSSLPQGQKEIYSALSIWYKFYPLLIIYKNGSRDINHARFKKLVANLPLKEVFKQIPEIIQL